MIRHKTRGVILICLGLIGDVGAAGSENIFGIKTPQSLEEMMSIVHEDAEAPFKFKMTYSAYFFQGKQHYDDPRLGYSLAYASVAGTDISVYVYDLGMTGISNGTQSEEVAAELVKASRALTDSDRYIRVQQQSASPLFSPHFLQATHTLTTSDGASLYSHTLVRGQHGYFIKVRITGTSSGMEGRLVDFFKYLAIDVGIEEGD